MQQVKYHLATKQNFVAGELFCLSSWSLLLSNDFFTAALPSTTIRFFFFLLLDKDQQQHECVCSKGEVLSTRLTSACKHEALLCFMQEGDAWLLWRLQWRWCWNYLPQSLPWLRTFLSSRSSYVSCWAPPRRNNPVIRSEHRECQSTIMLSHDQMMVCTFRLTSCQDEMKTP